MASLKDELKILIELSVTIAAIPEEDRKLLTEKLLELPEDKMQQAIDELKAEQKAHNDAMRDMVKQIKIASNNLKKSFLKDKESREKRETEKESDALLKQLEDE